MIPEKPFSRLPATDRMFDRIVQYILIALVVPFLISGAIASYRAFVQVRRLDLDVKEVSLRAGSRVEATVVSSGRVPVTLRIELVQGTRAETLAVRVVPNSADPFFDPRTVRGALSTTVTTELLARFSPGPALIRATARGRPQWMREPPPLVRQAAVVIDSIRP